ncbi:septal ring lytic transglycosylase RlpA family protein [Oscillatoria sp. FACHB-1406]|uniref:septal ring lytic transglycosylase RlpA family protein n=1 Tax=Oscillatoria sp. FACHB-1406 TaxID=2692846 RepID=UPI00168573DC|nr:septal ring lytic transglycosylase RlpA family protein [Oscillatoria sp. FACHB-1406]MBD2577821.1 septal ring lytic transglycosylase RlpA family protein [Oscillatoria sp. FACHB-1406]
MSQKFLGSLTASLVLTALGTTAAIAQTLPPSQNVAANSATIATTSTPTRILTHKLGDSNAATLYIRSIPLLTFVAAPAQNDPAQAANAVAERLKALNPNDANAITVGWNEARQAYLMTLNGQELALVDGKQTILPDTTRNVTQDAIQATNRLRRLLGNAAPLQANQLILRPEAAAAPQAPEQRTVSVQRGMASWYGPGFHGRLSASGERFNQNAMTAAHRTLPFGTRVRVTNRNNGQSAIVRINDRGPFVRGRIIDLSVGAAKQIGMYGSGVAPVEVEVLGR